MRFHIALLAFLVSPYILHAESVGTLLEPTRIPLTHNGKEVGSTTVVPGTKVKVVREEAGKTLVATSSGQTWVSSTAVHQGDSPAPLPVKATPTPTPPPKATPSPTQRPVNAAPKSGSTEIDIPKKPTEEEVPDFLTATAKPVEAVAEVPQKKVLVIPSSGTWGGSAMTHSNLARLLKEHGQDITIMGRQPKTWKAGDLLAPLAQEKWLEREKVVLADYDVLLTSTFGGSNRPDCLFFEANKLGKLIVIAQDEGPWLFVDDEEKAQKIEAAYLREQLEKGYLQKKSRNVHWENSPTFDPAAVVQPHESDSVRKSEMRPGDVIAYENIVCYNTSPNGTRGEELSSSGYRWDYGKGWEGLGGYNAKSAEKLASTVLLPAVLEAIRTHKENPKDMTPPTLTKASYLPPRPTLPLVFPPTRPKQAGKVISWGGQQTGVAAPQPKLIAALTVPEGLRAVQVVTTWDNACIALKPNGTVVAWGDNKNGLNDVPEGLANVVQIAAGNKIAAALKGDGTVVTWGAGAPPPYDSSNVVQIAIADDSLFGLKSDGTLAGRSNDSRFISPTNLVQIVGGAHPIGLTQDGKVVALKNITEKEFYIPENLGEVHSLAQCHDSQARHVSALLVDGTVAAWGRDDSGQATVPKGLKDVVRVSSSNDNTFAILRNGKVEGWGSNWFRQQDFPKELRNAIQVSGGGGVVLGIVKD